MLEESKFQLPCEPSDQIQLVITYSPSSGACNVAGPINNKQLCYGIMELAKDAIRDFVAQQQCRVQPVPFMPGGLS